MLGKGKKKEVKKTFFKGTYEAVEKIGAGSFGIVYKAKKSDYNIESFCAIKQIEIPKSDDEIENLKKDGLSNEKIKKFFQSIVDKWVDEIKLMELFKDSTNIVNIEDYEILEDKKNMKWTINIKMELLSSLDSYIQATDLTDSDALKMAIDITNALIDCKKNKVIHRDIKPDNIFVNKNKVFKLGDFGVAKKVQSTISNLSRRGTENYMSPEIYSNGKGDYTTDIYSLGIVLYKYFNCNRLPFLPDYPEDILADHYNDALMKRMNGEKMKPPYNANKNISNIILKMCEYYPNDRYQDLEELLKDLEKEYKKINKPKVLFYLDEKKQEKLMGKEKNKSNHDSTLSVFSDKTEKEDIVNNEPPKKEETIKEKVGVIKKESKTKKKELLFLPVAFILIIVIVLIITIPRKEKFITVPNITNSSFEKATLKLEKTGLDIENEYVEVNDKEKIGTVLDQSIKSGTKVKKNTLIKIKIGVSQEKIEVIDVVGKTREDAIKAIEELSLSAKITERNDNDVEKNLVISQIPIAGEKVSKGEVIEILVSLGKEEDIHNNTNTSNYNNWSNWTESLPSGITGSSYDIEKKIQYSYRDKQTTTSTDSYLDGWTLYDQKTIENRVRRMNYNRSDQDIEKMLEKGNIEIISKVHSNTYAYAKYCKNSSGQCAAMSENWSCPSGYSGWQRTDMPIGNQEPANGQIVTVDGCPYKIVNYWTVYNITFDEIEKSTTYYFYTFSDWSNYSDTRIDSNSNREVRTRILYRYKKK